MRPLLVATTLSTLINGYAGLISLVLVGCQPDETTTAPAQTPSLRPSPGPGLEKLAFVSTRDGNAEVYVMNAAGNGVTNLTNNPGLDGQPAWSPDGKFLAFMSRRDGNQEIYVMKANGSGQTRLTNNFAADEHPVWSPDGKKIAFVSRRDGNREVYVMKPDGSAQTNLSQNPASDDQPAWAPNSRSLVFISERDPVPNPNNNSVEPAEVWTMSVSGNNQTRLTTDNGQDFTPSWSPDGTRIVYRKFGNVDARIVVSDANGVVSLIVADGDGNVDPAWSPNGAVIAFSRTLQIVVESHEIFTVTPPADTGVDLSNLKLDHLGDFKPLWSPSGKWLAFQSTRDGNSEIYVMHPNGSGQTNLTQNPAVDNQVAWRP